MNPVIVSAILCGLIALAALVWSERHCIRHTWLQRLAFGIFGSMALLVGFSQTTRVAEFLDALPGNVRAWLWVFLLSGFALEAWRQALERKR